MNKTIRAISAAVIVAVWIALTGFAWFGPSKDISEAERRPLQQMPEISVDTLLNGKFMGTFEDYTLDQFPLRDTFRTLKSLFSYNVMLRQDNNDIYMEDGYAAKLEYPLDDVSLTYALNKFNSIYETYLKDSNCSIYMSVIPDKGYYLAEANGYPAMDYEKLFQTMAAGMPYAQMIDITESLDITDYYYTDTHWRQEKIVEAAKVLCDAMGAAAPKAEDFTATPIQRPFYGVYYGQAALPMDPEELFIMRNSLLETCRVYNYETGRYQKIYDMAKVNGSDPYDVFLSGAQALLTIENPKAATDKELILFRDSFGSSLAPLLVQGYRSVTLVDIRYMNPLLLKDYLTFDGQDVLFAYSSLILNSSSSLK